MARAHERFNLEGRISLKVPDSAFLNMFDAALENISFGGFRMSVASKIGIDTVVDFKLFSLLVDEPLTGKGRVKYVKEEPYRQSADYKMGVEFTDVNKDLLQFLMTRIHSLDNREKFSRLRKKGMDMKGIPF